MTFYRLPFANDDADRSVPPINATGDDSVSFQEGYTVRYEEDPETSGTARRIERDEYNGILFSITSEIRQYQTLGTPEFITSSDNNGAPFSYAVNARVRLNNVVYQSLANNNTTTPPSAGNWIDVSNPVTTSNFSTGLRYSDLTSIASNIVQSGVDLLSIWDSSESELRSISPSALKNVLGVQPLTGQTFTGQLNVSYNITGNTAAGIVLNNAQGTISTAIELAIDGISGGTVRYLSGSGLRIQNNISATTFSVQDNGTLAMFNAIGNPFVVTGQGDVHAERDVISFSSVTTSDKRLKKSIEYKDIAECLEEILKTRPANFEFKKEPGRKRLGFIAQDLESVTSESVKTIKNELGGDLDEYLALDIVAIVSNLVGAIKAQQETIEDQESRINAIEELLSMR